METKNILLFCIISNSIALICFTILAILFNHWWIIFFALLFHSSPREARHRICDKCGKMSPSANTPEEAIKLAVKCGWVHYDNGDLDYCPDCKNEVIVNGK